jgi:uncharacterized membrane protein
MTAYFLLKYLHVIGAAVLLGTGAGIAFFMLIAHVRGEVAGIAAVARIVVLADFVFTATAVVVQPITGVLLAREAGYDLSEGWLSLSILLYIVTGTFWLPVVWMQMRLRDLAVAAARKQTTLPASFHRLFWLWFSFGFPAFGAILCILWLMIVRPVVHILPSGVNSCTGRCPARPTIFLIVRPDRRSRRVDSNSARTRPRKS